jgi:hypothetical protein
MSLQPEPAVVHANAMEVVSLMFRLGRAKSKVSYDKDGDPFPALSNGTTPPPDRAYTDEPLLMALSSVVMRHRTHGGRIRLLQDGSVECENCREVVAVFDDELPSHPGRPFDCKAERL